MEDERAKKNKAGKVRKSFSQQMTCEAFLSL